jgi:hypothetical protein
MAGIDGRIDVEHAHARLNPTIAQEVFRGIDLVGDAHARLDAVLAAFLGAELDQMRAAP